ncbi:MAG: hypothetical protein H0W02_00195 [Ktedonobacteraceae bacterium]|nr:hypothetical protein [Ktedonobacteraceae bacterium]
MNDPGEKVYPLTPLFAAVAVGLGTACVGRAVGVGALFVAVAVAIGALGVAVRSVMPPRHSVSTHCSLSPLARSPSDSRRRLQRYRTLRTSQQPRRR